MISVDVCWFPTHPTTVRPDGSFDSCRKPAVIWLTDSSRPGAWGYCQEHSRLPSTISFCQEKPSLVVTWEEALVHELMAS